MPGILLVKNVWLSRSYSVCHGLSVVSGVGVGGGGGGGEEEVFQGIYKYTFCRLTV